MKNDEALLYLPHRGLPPTLEVECASQQCANKFQLAHGFAYQAWCENQVITAFFCSRACYLQAIPCKQCPRA